ncbi:BolA-like protein [Akanthomyces lecanii RCEF 1005]|uniref:BolA-like protein n=1 Tax=Akanthomyces lecanii RCEF 1005 TaxID=1081108 RepID=A0A162MWH3_CORDF|nr:BolA-like protein [Akanthomyces lecanii RCEF 1005]
MQSSLCAACRRAAATTTLRAPRTVLSRHLSATVAATRQRPVVQSRPAPLSLHSHLRARRPYSSAAAAPETPSMSDAESAIAQLLVDALAPVSSVLVQDVSGGCGSMYAIEIAAEAFRGKTMLKQQRMVNAALGDVVKTWHGVQIRTSVPEDA